MLIRTPKTKSKYYSRESTGFIDKSFQLKYTHLNLFTFIFVSIALITPILYFWRENYNIFIEMAYLQSPTLVEHLERENYFIYILVAGTLFCACLFLYYMSIKMTSHIIAPIKLFKNHLYNLARGRWFVRSLKIRDDDEFQELADTYNYFYKSFQKNIENDLNRLLKIKIDPKDQVNYLEWKQIIEEKCQQLNKNNEFLKSILNDVNEKQLHDQNRAS